MSPVRTADRLFAACQRWHLAYDSGHHAVTRARTRQAHITAGMEPLPGPWPEPKAAGTSPRGFPLCDDSGGEYDAAIERAGQTGLQAGQ